MGYLKVILYLKGISDWNGDFQLNFKGEIILHVAPDAGFEPATK